KTHGKESATDYNRPIAQQETGCDCASASGPKRFGEWRAQVTDTSPERLAHTNRINRLQFAEYKAVGWIWISSGCSSVSGCYAINPRASEPTGRILAVRAPLVLQRPALMSSTARRRRSVDESV